MTHNKSAGFSLLEVLITILLTAIGILGMVAMQGKAIQYTQDSVERTNAVILASDLMEIVRATPSSQADEAISEPFFDGLPAGETSGCLTLAANELIDKQVACWAARARSLLPGADEAAEHFRSCISATPGECDENGAAMEIRLAWHASGEGCIDAEAEELDDSLCLYTLRTQI